MARRLGLALSSGAARGWAHVGVLRGLEEAGLKPDVIAGCSVGALVGGAHLLGVVEEVCTWARELSPLSALAQFGVSFRSGGMLSAQNAFAPFAEKDRPIEELAIRFGAVATDLGGGEPVEIVHGSVIDAVRASTAIPIVFDAVQREGRWLVDGALCDPMPVGLARKLGADVVVGVDLTGVARTIDRFDPPPPGPPAVLPPDEIQDPGMLPAPLSKLIRDTRSYVEHQIESARLRSRAKPQILETSLAAADIFQMHLTRARAFYQPPDIHLKPDMREALPTAFDRADEFIEEGRRAVLEKADDIRRLLELEPQGDHAIA